LQEVWDFPTNTSSGLQGLQPCESIIKQFKNNMKIVINGDTPQIIQQLSFLIHVDASWIYESCFHLSNDKYWL